MFRQLSKRWGVHAILLVGFVVPIEVAWHYLPSYLIALSHHALSPKDAFLPVVLMGWALVVGTFSGLVVATIQHKR
ncbi:MAG: hypothetical protein OWU33_09335 [Firmicutes bacterium]|nr:hypothetical protein [Bacillota bacterium]